MEKWLPLFDTIHEVVVAINNTQFLFGGGTWTGLIRFREYIINDPVREQHNMVPEEYFPVKAYQNISDDITLVEPVRDGYIFDGWYDDPLFGGTARTIIAKADTGNLTLYAKWSDPIVEHQVTLDLNYDGLFLDPLTVVDGELAVKPTDPTREFYTFKGLGITR